jgi:NAD(P)-dependent dehydrogenase (short-subunit alcohol dehydrogenase family)
LTAAPGLVWLTGASAGIGRALALRLARDGWRVAASARRGDALDSLRQEARGLPGEIRAFPVDVTDRRAVAACVAAIEREFGRIDLALLNAGTHEPMPADKFSAAIVQRLLDINVMGVANGLEAVLPLLIARGAGRVAIVASLAGYGGLPSAAAYGASKAALINMAESLRPELLERGVVLQVINPGFVKTPLTDKNDFDMPFLISAEDAAEAILRGLKSDRFEIAFPGAFVRLMKLLRLLPYGLYFRLTRRLVRR